MRPFDEERNEENQLDLSVHLELWGSVLSTVGDALQGLGVIVAIDEGKVAEQEQQERIDKLQEQIDELKKEQKTTEDMNKRLEKLIEKIESK